MQLFGAGEVEERLVDRERLDQRRQRLHHRPHLAADADVFLHVRRDHDGVGAGLERLEHRHRRTHAADAGDVAGGGDDAALAAADDDRLVGQLRIVALFDGRIEGVAIDMGEVQAIEFGMPGQARAAAGRATRRQPGCGARQSRQKPCSGLLTAAAMSANINGTNAMIGQCSGARKARRGRRSCDDARHCPVTPDLWPAFEDLFGKQGACYGCWCTHFRLPPAVRRENDRQRNKDLIHARIVAGPPPGLLAFDDGQPIGWMQIGRVPTFRNGTMPAVFPHRWSRTTDADGACGRSPASSFEIRRGAGVFRTNW